MFTQKDFKTILTLLKDRQFKLEVGNLNYTSNYIKHEKDIISTLIKKTENYIKLFERTSKAI